MQKFTVGLTGPTGSGKSTAKTVAEGLGFFCIDADKVARTATEISSPLLPKLAEEFGDILNPDGSLNRKKLAAAAFCEKEKTERLNAIMLPYIVTLIENIILKSNTNLILLDAPTLIEAGADRLCQKTVGVLADRELRKARIMARDNMTEKEAEARLNAGKPPEFYQKNCDHIIYNNGTETEFLESAEKLFKKLLRRQNEDS